MHICYSQNCGPVELNHVFIESRSEKNKPASVLAHFVFLKGSFPCFSMEAEMSSVCSGSHPAGVLN